MENTKHYKNFNKALFSEMLGYEYLWSQEGSTVKRISEFFSNPQIVPSKLLPNTLFSDTEISKIRDFLEKSILSEENSDFSIMVSNDSRFPKQLFSATKKLNTFYYKGNIDLTKERCISIVGSRKASEEGVKRARKLAFLLVDNGFTIVSGLAIGIDTSAMKSAIERNGNVIGVIGTPINQYYPKENKGLQDYVAKHHLLISQVPFYKYANQPFRSKNVYFPERNATMSALSEATIIVEASETSGTLTQARACLAQGKKLFILNSCFENKAITWPEKYLKKGAIRVKNSEDILQSLK